MNHKQDKQGKATIHLSVRVAAFIASVIFLSWCFAGYRSIRQAPSLTHWEFLAGSVLMTILMLGLQGYWIYFDEKDKGTLRRRIALFERIHSWLNQAQRI